MVDESLLQQILDLPVEDRTELFYELGATLETREPPLSPEFSALLDERVAEARAHPEDSVPWDEVMQDLRARHLK